MKKGDMMTDSNRVPNRLVTEKSPYLLQHAYNPVDWYPWGDEAFEKAKREDKPVFLSIGYSTCHWCHVMERESFEDQEVADYLNAHFVAIKVDKEERPDVDAVYMQVCQALTGSGGWPLTVFLAPDKKAFFAGTYFPKTSRYGMNGLMEVLASVVKLWKHGREKLLRQGDQILKKLGGGNADHVDIVTKRDFHAAYETFRRTFDEKNGGFGYAPKFPTPNNLMFLLRHYYFEQEPEALEMTKKTLRQMYRGGIFDHIGGGFSRYSTDDKWLVPHFEKMLCDNALLTLTYLEAYQVTGDELFKMVVGKTLGYIRREMTDEEGGFYSAQDADSEGEEGKYYVLTTGAIRGILGDEDGEYFCRHFGITEEGNFEGASIPNLLKNPAYDAQDERIESLIPAVYEFRRGRSKLFRDEKILTGWNALMIAAFARAYQVLGKEAYLKTAERSASFVTEKLTAPDGRLYVRYRDGEAAGTGYLEDYAYTAWALLSLYDAAFDAVVLERAIRYAETMCQYFEDTENGGFYQYAGDAEVLPLRLKETYDGAVPSGNAVAAYMLCRLAKLTAEPVWEERARRQLAFLSAAVKEYPAAHCFGLIAAQQELYPSKEVICCLPSGQDIDMVRDALARAFLPNTSLLVKTKDNEGRVNTIAPFAKAYLVMEGKPNFYICENKTCALPITDIDGLINRLENRQQTIT
jgi:uncharacterized protein YyaL (SSP411 family)